MGVHGSPLLEPPTSERSQPARIQNLLQDQFGLYRFSGHHKLAPDTGATEGEPVVVALVGSGF